MNKKGNIFMGVAITLIVYIFGILFLPFIIDDITNSRTDLDCTNTDISDGSKLTCLAISGLAPYFIWLVISIALGFLAGRRSP